MYRRPRIIPCLLLDNQKAVKTEKFASPRYIGDPVNAVRIFNNKGIDELCLLDITASKQGRKPDLGFLHDIASEAYMPLSYGGGITTLEQVRALFASGYEKLVFNTPLFRDEELIRNSVAYAGSSSIVASIDAKRTFTGKYVCYTRGGSERVKITPREAALRAEDLGVGEILLYSMDNDGQMQGYDLDLVRSVADAVSVPLIACGGAGSLSHIKSVLTEGHAHAAAGGSMFVYYGRNRAVLINAPTEQELIAAGIYSEDA